MSMFFFRGITVELSTQDDHFLTDIFYLILELKLSDGSVERTDLLSRESSPGVWDANEPLTLNEIVAHFTLSVFTDLGGDEHQLLASRELYGTDLWDGLGETTGILLDGHENYPNMILKTKIIAADSSRQALGAEQPNKLNSLLRPRSQVLSSNPEVPSFYGLGCLRYPEDINTSIERQQLEASLTPNDHPDKPSQLSHLGWTLLTRFRRLGNLGDINDAVTQYQAAINLTPDGHPDKREMLSDLGHILQARFECLGDIDDIDNSIAKHQEAVDLTPDIHPDKPGMLGNIGSSLLARFDRLGNRDDIDNAIERHQAAVDLTPHDHPRKLAMLTNLGHSLRTRFEHLGNLRDLDNTIAHYQAAVDLISNDNPHKPGLLTNLGKALLIRFQSLGNLDDIDGSIAQHQMSVDLTPDADARKPGLLDNLGNSLLIRFQRLGNLDDMDNAIVQHQAAVDPTPDDHIDKARSLSNLGSSLHARFQRLGNLDDIDDAILRLQEAVDLSPDCHPDKCMRLANFGSILLARFDRFGNRDDIDNAILQHQAAVNLAPDGHPHMREMLNNLGNSFSARFGRLGNLDDIDNAIIPRQAAVDLTPDGHPHKPRVLSNLGSSFFIRFGRLGNLDDVDNVITKYQAAVDLTPDGHPDKPALSRNLGTSLVARFQRLGNIGDIDNATEQLQAAVKLTPEGHPDMPSLLSSFGNSLEIRFKRLKNMGDIGNAIVQHQAAVKLTPDDHPERPARLNSLGIALLARFQQFGNLNDVNDAIERHQVAVKLTPGDHPDKSSRLSNLGHALCVRFNRLGNRDNIDNSILNHQEAVDLTPDGHPQKPGRLANFGIPLFCRFQRFGHPKDAESCVAQFSAAALSPVASPPDCLMAAKKWVHAAPITNHTSLLAACECVVGTIPLVAWLGLSIKDRHQHLVQIGETVRAVAAIAISLGQCNKALEWLEQGRSIVWTQILQLRTPVDQLRDIEPDLADRLLHISQLLDEGTQDVNPQSEHRRSPEEEARQYRALAREHNEVVAKIRSLPNFHDFLRPPTIHKLFGAAKDGPVVVINVSDAQCDALALVYGVDEAIHIPLPNLTSERVTELQVELKSILKSNGIRLRAVRDEEAEGDGGEGCKWILAELWDNLVKPVLDSLAFSSDPEILPRMWWCVTGPLAFLPIHAAGVYDTEDSGEKIQDYAIVSYVPTISALLEQPDAPEHSPFRHLSAIEPSSGASYIPNTEKEMEYIRRRLQNRDHVVLHKAEATKERVVDAMKDCNWLHLACHGTQNPTDPTKSALLLHDGKLTLEEIIRLNLPHAEFAFLSACQTMTGDENLSDEAVHIAGGMSLAGYRSVVATMWSIEDELAPKVADEFYARLFQDEERPDNRKTAEALHFSVKKLREEEDIEMLSWIPFVHLGI